jgi:hypothetical protein
MKISELQASNPSVYSTDKFTGHAYGEFYDKLFEGKENENLCILEVGVNEGGSIRLWHDYLRKSITVGIDIVDLWRGADKSDYPRLALLFNSNAYVEIPSFIYADFDVIVDDGPHTIESQIYALKNFPSYLKSGGLLVIEDVPSGVESEIIKHAPPGGQVEVIDLRHITGRWDDCLITFKKD